MSHNQIIIECKRVKFYSSYDETTFFEWVKSIKCINNFKGQGESILLYVENKNIEDKELHNFIALFRRYKINMKQLEIFLNDANKEHFYQYQQGYSINVYPAQ